MHHFSNNNPIPAVPHRELLEAGQIPWSSWMNLNNMWGVSDTTLPWWAVQQQMEHLHSRRRGFPGPLTPMRWAEFGREATLSHDQQPPPFPSTNHLPKRIVFCSFICRHGGKPLAAPLERLSTHPSEAGTLLFVQLSSQQGGAKAQRGNWS